MVEWYEFVAVVVSFVIGIVGASGYYRKFKKAMKEAVSKFEEVMKCVKSIDQAFEDDKITKEEVKMIWDNCKFIIKEFEDIVKR